ncbi:MAG: T9SS type A sorting domain-containing protein, partial [Candidatus Cloacimonetes bacterium]|nr:T9SS type A sorting domain-containing protein [Candidatus Cloacimonadota bacterium]
PNPLAGGSTKISFLLPKTSMVEVKIYNIRGQLVKDLYKGVANTDDEVSIPWDGRDETGTLQSTGIYLYQLTINGKLYEIKRLIVIR